MCKFQIGDRVSRPLNVYEAKSSILKGTVVCVYGFDLKWTWLKSWIASKLDGNWRYPEVYNVMWDNENTISTGYLPHGLEHENFIWYNQR